MIASSFFPLNESQILLLWPRFPKNDVTLIIEFQDKCFNFLPTIQILKCKNQLIIGLVLTARLGRSDSHNVMRQLYCPDCVIQAMSLQLLYTSKDLDIFYKTPPKKDNEHCQSMVYSVDSIKRTVLLYILSLLNILFSTVNFKKSLLKILYIKKKVHEKLNVRYI